MQLTDEWPEKTIGTFWPYAPTLFDFIRRSKPMMQPGNLTDSEVYALTAYLLYLNGIIPEDREMNAATLAGMPNRTVLSRFWMSSTISKSELADKFRSST